MTTDTNKTTPVAEPASEPPHRLDSWATECSEPATDKDHLPVAPASAADGLPEPVARLLRWCGPSYMQVPHDGLAARTFAEFPLKESTSAHAYWKDGALLYTADQLRTAIAAERRKTRLLEFKLKERAHPTSEPRDPPEILSSLGFWPDCGCGECYAIHCLGEAQAELSTLRQQLAEAVRERDALRAQVDAAVPAMRDYARRNPRWESWDNGEVEGKMQDPNGVNAWLEQIDAAIAAQGEAKPPGVERELFEGE